MLLNGGAFAQTFDSAPVTLSTLGGPLCPVIGDLDGDGKPDLVVSNYGQGYGSTVSVFRNTSSTGALIFAAVGNFTVGVGPEGVAIGDLDGDGFPEIVTADATALTVSILLNTSRSGAITFAPLFTAATLITPHQVSLNDIDGDGKLDLVITSNGGSAVHVYRNTSTLGALSFSAPVVLPTTSYLHAVAVGDLDQDGKPDIVVPVGYSHVVSVFRNTSSPGNISFSPRVDLAINALPCGIAVADIDGDGQNDIVVTSDNYLWVLKNGSTPGLLSFQQPQAFTTGVPQSQLAVSDLNRDGRPDVLFANAANYGASILANLSSEGVIAFSARMDLPIAAYPSDVGAGDLSGDRLPEVVVPDASGTLSVFRNETPAPGTGFQFPLPGATPSTTVITSLFDHDMTGRYRYDGLSTAFSGEQGSRDGRGCDVDPYDAAPSRSYSKWDSFNGMCVGGVFTILGYRYWEGSPHRSFLSYDDHPGYDYRTNDLNAGAASVFSAAPGRVTLDRPQSCNGLECTTPCSVTNLPAWGGVMIQHDPPYQEYATCYLHLAKPFVKDGDHVTGGVEIGVSGHTAPITVGDHLHFEVYRRLSSGNYAPVDPYGWCGAGKDVYEERNPSLPAGVNRYLWSTTVPGPLSLRQVCAGNLERVPIGAVTRKRDLILKGTVFDPAVSVVSRVCDPTIAGGRVILEVELRRLDEYGGRFDATKGGLNRSDAVTSGSEASVKVAGLIDGQYHWRARAVSEDGVAVGDWVSFGGDVPSTEFFGGNLDNEPDFVVSEPNPPVAAGSCSIDYAKWTATCDAAGSTFGAGFKQLVFEWGDGTVVTRLTSVPTGPQVHEFLQKGSFAIKLRVTDTRDWESIAILGTTVPGNFGTPASAAIAGTVYSKAGARLGAAQVQVKKDGAIARSTMSSASGSYTIGNMKPGTYTLTVTKAGYTFPAPVTVTIPPNATQNVTATGP